MKSLAYRKEVEIIFFDDLAKDEKFVQEAAKRILQNDDMYSLYRKIYLSKENAIEENIGLCVRGMSPISLPIPKNKMDAAEWGSPSYSGKTFPLSKNMRISCEECGLKKRAPSTGKKMKSICICT